MASPEKPRTRKRRRKLLQHLRIAAVLLLWSSTVWPAGPIRRPVELLAYVDTGEGLEARCLTTAGDTLRLRVDAYANGVFRVRLFVRRLPPDSPMLAGRSWPKPEYEVIERPGEVTLITGELRLRIEKAPIRLVFHGPEGELLAEEPGGEGLWCSPEGIGEAFQLQAEESLFGLGSGGEFLNRRKRMLEMWVDSRKGAEVCAPFVLSSRSYGIFVHTARRAWFDLGRSDEDVLRFGHPDPQGLDYFLIHAPSPEAVVSRYVEITGRPPLLPLWSLGILLTGRWETEEAALTCAEEFGRRGLPLEAIIFEDPARVRDWRTLAQGLGNRRVGGILTPLVTIENPLFPVGLARGFFARNRDGSVPIVQCDGAFGCLIDLTDPKAEDWWWRSVTSGVGGLTLLQLRHTSEPEVVTTLRRFGNGLSGETFHNLFPLWSAKEVDRRLAPYGERLLIVDGGYPGLQRYACVRLSARHRGWEALASGLARALNAGLSGFPFWCLAEVADSTLRSPELYIRALQLIALSPIALLDGPLLSTPPWEFGDETLMAYRNFAGLRMRWLPLLYNLVVEAHQKGLPLWRPLALYYPEDPRAAEEVHEFLLGRDVLVAPVLKPSTAGGAAIRPVYLPEGQWYDYWSGLQFSGPRELSYKVDLSRCPIFVRSGAILPLGPPVRMAGDQLGGPITFLCFPGEGVSQIDLWEPAGGASRGDALARSSLEVAWRDTLLVSWKPAAGAKAASPRGVILRIPGRKASTVRANGRALPRLEDVSLADGRRPGWGLREDGKTDLYVSIPAEMSGAPLRLEICPE